MRKAGSRGPQRGAAGGRYGSYWGPEDEERTVVAGSVRPAGRPDSSQPARIVEGAIGTRRERRKGGAGVGRQLATAAIAVIVVASFAMMPFVLRTVLAPQATPRASDRPLPSLVSSSSATSTPLDTSYWKILATNGVMWASWSPDGKWLAVTDTEALPEGTATSSSQPQHLRVLGAAGDPVRILDGERFFWLDGTRFVMWRGDSAFLGSVESTDLKPVKIASGAVLPGGHGALAIVNTTVDEAKLSFVVWTPAGTSRVLAGIPVAWSWDGTRIAVWHYVGLGGGTQGFTTSYGWIEVLSWPDLGSVATLKNSAFVGQPVSFDPSGRYLEVSSVDLGSAVPNDQMVVPSFSVWDLSTGGPAVVSGVSGLSPAWDSTGDLLFIGVDGSLVTMPVSGGPVVSQSGAGDSVVSSADGSTAVVSYTSSSGQSPPITIIRNGASRTIPVPCLLAVATVVSPDGSNVVINCMHSMGEKGELLLLAG